MNSGNKTSYASEKEITIDSIREFFDSLIKQLEEDKQSMLLGIAPEATSKMYEQFIQGDPQVVLNTVMENQSRKTLIEMLTSYVNNFNTFKVNPKKLAFSLDKFTINVFAIIQDNDENTSHNLILSEASIIEKYYPRGFKMNTMIIEESDKISIPHGYLEFPPFTEKSPS